MFLSSVCRVYHCKGYTAAYEIPYYFEYKTQFTHFFLVAKLKCVLNSKNVHLYNLFLKPTFKKLDASYIRGRLIFEVMRYLPILGFVLSKVKLSLCSTNEDVWGSECICPRFLDLGTSWR
jgi:hypothetical protein